MSKEALAKIVQRAIGDAAFRRQLSTDPAGALRGFDLSADEAAAIRAGDAGRLSALGVDQRMSKAFALGGMAAATRAADTDLSAANALNSLNTGDLSALSSADASGATGTFGNALVSGNLAESDLLIDGGVSVHTVIPTEPGGASISADASGGEAHLTAIGYDDGVNVRMADADDVSGTAAVIPGSPEEAATRIDPVMGVTRTDDTSNDEGFLTSVGYDQGNLPTRIADDASGTPGVATDEGQLTGTAFMDDSEAYLSKVGSDTDAAGSAGPTTWSGDDIAGPSVESADTVDGGSAGADGGPNIQP